MKNKIKYKVKFMQDENYAVYEILNVSEDFWEEEKIYEGHLSDCEAYIRLKEKGYL